MNSKIDYILILLFINVFYKYILKLKVKHIYTKE